MQQFIQPIYLNYFSTIIHHISDMVLGVERIVGIYSNDGETNHLSGISLLFRNNQLIERELNIEGGTETKLREIQLEKIQYKWLNKSQVPFEIHESNQKQLNIFDEHSHLVLLLSIPSPKSDLRRDLVFIYFKDDIDQFGIHHQKSKLSTQNKTIIGHLISNSVKSCAHIYWEQEEKLMKFTIKSQHIINQRINNGENIEGENGLKKLIIGWAQSTIDDFSKSDGVNYVYGEGAIDKIVSYKGEFKELKHAIQEAIEYVKILSAYINPSNQLIIEKEYITFVNIPKQNDTNVNDATSPRLRKAHELLDKLEKHALLISQHGLNLTSYNVGQSMERSITPAAISDSISKNRDRINALFKRYPDKWSFIRNNFRPIINVTSKENDLQRNWG